MFCTCHGSSLITIKEKEKVFISVRSARPSLSAVVLPDVDNDENAPCSCDKKRKMSNLSEG